MELLVTTEPFCWVTNEGSWSREGRLDLAVGHYCPRKAVKMMRMYLT